MLVPGLAPGALLAIWGGTTVFAALAASTLVFRPASWIRLVAQLATGGLLMAIGVASLLLRWEAGGDSAALIVDGMLLAGGLGFLVVPIRLSARGIAD
jgi:hypothetical protein